MPNFHIHGLAAGLLASLSAGASVVCAPAFAVPDELFGEEVAAAVVMRAQSKFDAEQIKQFASGYLSDFKVPELVRKLSEIPKGRTGKPDRLGPKMNEGDLLKQSSAVTEPV